MKKAKKFKARFATHFLGKKAGVKKVRKAKPKSRAQVGRKLVGSKAFPVRFRVLSKSSGNLYTVAQTRNGEWRCNCMGHIRYGQCKHAFEIMKRVRVSKSIQKTKGK